MEKKEAMKILKDFHDKSALFSVRTALDTIIPELRESEDERIMKDVKRAISVALDYSYFDKETANNCLAWLGKQGYTKKDIDDAYLKGICNTKHELEKQGEQESADKYEQKFHVGEWIVWQNKCYKVNDNGCGYELIEQNGLSTSLEYGTVDKSAHLWTIQDAKDGDVLVHNSIIFIFIGIENGIVKGICTELSDTILNFGEPEYDNDYCPATKEQRDIIFTKMKEAGWEWNSEKKELKEIDPKPHGQRKECLDCQFNYAGECKGSCHMKREEQKVPVVDFKAKDWYVSKVDGKIHNIYNSVDKIEQNFKVKYAGNEYNVFEIKDINGVTYYGIEDEPNHIDYVKAENCEIISGYAIKENGSPYPTKPAVFSEKKPQRMVSAEAKEALYDKPTDEEMKELLRTEYEKGRADTIAEMYVPTQISPEESLGVSSEKYMDIVDTLTQGRQKPAKWSLEDERVIAIINNALTESNTPPDDYDKVYDWLESIKQRIGWKPSNEQIDALEHFVRSIGESGYASPYDNNTKLLYSLLEQLKKLKA